MRIIPQHGRFIVEVVYRTNKEITYKPDNGRNLSIDPGLDNAFALASNVDGFQPVLINGRPIKALNQYYNKERARPMISRTSPVQADVLRGLSSSGTRRSTALHMKQADASLI